MLELLVRVRLPRHHPPVSVSQLPRHLPTVSVSQLPRHHPTVSVSRLLASLHSSLLADSHLLMFLKVPLTKA